VNILNPDPNRGETIISETRNGIPGELLDYYTFKGFKTMARFSINFGTLLGMDESMGQDAFKLYGEWALFGVKDQPFYYDRKSERMPVMVGLNIPTFGILDEYIEGSRDARIKEIEKDDWKWSIYARKQITEGLTVFGQAARDHLRQITWEGGPKFAGHSSTQFSGEWYYILRLELGI
jgi:hypothetical protein